MTTTTETDNRTNTLDAFVATNHITMTSEYADSNPNMDNPNWQANHYRVTLRYGRRRFSLYFSQGIGISGEPKTASVLDCLASDASGVENARDFEDWCGEYGYDTDSRRAERTYRTCRRQAARLKRLLGDDLYDQLLRHTERL